MTANRSKRDAQKKNDEMQRLWKLIEQENQKRIAFVQKRYRSKEKNHEYDLLTENTDYEGENLDDERIRCISDTVERTRSMRANQQSTIVAFEAESERVYQQLAADIRSSSDSLEKRGGYRLGKREFATAIAELTSTTKRAAKSVIAAIDIIKDQILKLTYNYPRDSREKF